MRLIRKKDFCGACGGAEWSGIERGDKCRIVGASEEWEIQNGKDWWRSWILKLKSVMSGGVSKDHVPNDFHLSHVSDLVLPLSLPTVHLQCLFWKNVRQFLIL